MKVRLLVIVNQVDTGERSHNSYMRCPLLARLHMEVDYFDQILEQNLPSFCPLPPSHPPPPPPPHHTFTTSLSHPPSHTLPLPPSLSHLPHTLLTTSFSQPLTLYHLPSHTSFTHPAQPPSHNLSLSHPPSQTYHLPFHNLLTTSPSHTLPLTLHHLIPFHNLLTTSPSHTLPLTPSSHTLAPFQHSFTCTLRVTSRTYKPVIRTLYGGKTVRPNSLTESRRVSSESSPSSFFDNEARKFPSLKFSNKLVSRFFILDPRKLRGGLVSTIVFA